MKRIVVIAVMSLCVRASESHASCAPMPAQQVTLVVDTCTAVDTSTARLASRAKQYAGIVLDGTLTAGTSKPSATRVWVPASEKLTCAQVVPASTITATLSFACCDGDPNAPCMIDTSSILTKVKVKVAAAAKPVKQATRAELEAEVEALRAENKKLRAEVEAVLAREKERARRLEAELDALQKQLK